MNPENRYFDLNPRIVLAGRLSTIRIHPLYDHARFKDEETYQVSVQAMEDLGGEETSAIYHLHPVNGDLVFQHNFSAEQEYSLRIHPSWNEAKKHATQLHLYAVAEDLYPLRPYKGDLHMHTFRSDGLESPAFVAAACRRIGLDFVAITDHHLYSPSLEAIQAFADVPTNLRIYPGEEVHPPENRVHMVNFGGRYSINDLFVSDDYLPGVKAIEERLTNFPPGPLRYQYASCLWVFSQIRSAGGLAILCHPYWVQNYHYNVPEDLLKHFFEDLPFDAYELIGGYFRFEAESNLLQVARYHEDRAQGKRIPIVGSSDSHGCEDADLFGWYYTIVLANSTELPELIDSIKSLRSVAVEGLPGERIRVHGPFRLVKYAHFLIREVLPYHDELCQAEGRLLHAYLEGDSSAISGLIPLRGQAARLYQQLWGMS